MTEWEDGDRTLHRRTDLQNRRDIRNATDWLDRVADVFDTLGWDTAAENLRRYRSGTGEPKIYSRDEIERHDPILMAEDRNRTRFEANTLLGKTDNKVTKKKLLNLKDGETDVIQDDWDMEPFSLQKGDLLERAKRAMNFVTRLRTHKGDSRIGSGLIQTPKLGSFLWPTIISGSQTSNSPASGPCCRTSRAVFPGSMTAASSAVSSMSSALA